MQHSENSVLPDNQTVDRWYKQEKRNLGTRSCLHYEAIDIVRCINIPLAHHGAIHSAAAALNIKELDSVGSAGSVPADLRASRDEHGCTALWVRSGPGLGSGLEPPGGTGT
jgi:hypothetical protein